MGNVAVTGTADDCRAIHGGLVVGGGAWVMHDLPCLNPSGVRDSSAALSSAPESCNLSVSACSTVSVRGRRRAVSISEWKVVPESVKVN
jgi:hypothetical protein